MTDTAFVFAVLFPPALLISLGWRNWLRHSADLPRGRRHIAFIGLISASVAWVLLLSLRYVGGACGDSLVSWLYDYRHPYGMMLSLIALALTFFGSGRVRVYSVVGALGTSWVWFLGVLANYSVDSMMHQMFG